MKNRGNLNSPTVCERKQNAPAVRRAAGANDRGQALLELALVLPILATLLIGAIEFGIVAYAAVEVSNAATAGAMYGAYNHANAIDNTGITNAAKSDALNNTYGNLTTLNVTGVTQWCACEGATAKSVSSAVACAGFVNSSCISPNRIVEWVQVDTGSTIDPGFHLPAPIPNTFALKGHATMRVGQ